MGMLTVCIRAVILYLVSALAMRLMGKRQLGQLQPYEFVMALLIADLAASPMENVETPLLYGIGPILALVCLHALLTVLDVKCPRVRKWLCAAPSVVIRDGVIQRDEMKRLNYTLSDLCEEVRAGGVLDVNCVQTAILETSGKLSVFPKAMEEGVRRRDVHIQAQEEMIPLSLVMDGRMQREHLKVIGRDEKWLQTLLADVSLTPEGVFYASLDRDGFVSLHTLDGNFLRIRGNDGEGRGQ